MLNLKKEPEGSFVNNLSESIFSRVGWAKLFLAHHFERYNNGISECFSFWVGNKNTLPTLPDLGEKREVMKSSFLNRGEPLFISENVPTLERGNESKAYIFI